MFMQLGAIYAEAGSTRDDTNTDGPRLPRGVSVASGPGLLFRVSLAWRRGWVTLGALRRAR